MGMQQLPQSVPWKGAVDFQNGDWQAMPLLMDVRELRCYGSLMLFNNFTNSLILGFGLFKLNVHVWKRILKIYWKYPMYSNAGLKLYHWINNNFGCFGGDSAFGGFLFTICQTCIHHQTLLLTSPGNLWCVTYLLLASFPPYKWVNTNVLDLNRIMGALT